jgi:hypothetical protein
MTSLFEPRPDLNPRPISFDEFASWCPRTKFESDGERTIIGGHRGTRNVLGMLLRTFGLRDAVSVLHPREWTTGLQHADEHRQQDSQRRERWWQLARQAAQQLRENTGVSRVAVIGDLTRAEPLHFWSELLLVVWGLKGSRFSGYEAIRQLDSEGEIELIDPVHIFKVQQQAIQDEAVDV